MVTLTRRNKKDGLGFTLLEMLLVVALLVALLGAIVYNFESAKRGADLEEGARQVEALIRFAGAQAANSGKAVQLRFGDDAGNSSGSSTNSTSKPSSAAVNDVQPIEDLEAKLRVVYEADPVLQPGIFVDLPEAAPFLDAIADRVRIEKVRMPERPSNQGTNDLAVVQEASAPATTVTFYPDGSSETVDIILVSKEREDLRQMIVHLHGVTGAVRSELKVLDDLVPIEWMEDENSSERKQTSTGSSTGPETQPPQPSAQPTPMPEDPAFDDPTKNKTTTSTNAFEDFPQ